MPLMSGLLVEHRLAVDTDGFDVLARGELVDDRTGVGGSDGVVLVARVDAGIVEADDATFGVDERAARVAAADASIVFENGVDRCPARLTAGGRRADDAAGEGVVDLVDAVRIAGRVAGGIDLEPGGHGTVVVRQGRVAGALELDDGEVGAFTDGEDLGVHRLGSAGHGHLEECGAGHDVVVRDDDPVLGDDRATPDTGGISLFADLGVDEGALGQDLHDGLLDIGDVEAGPLRSSATSPSRSPWPSS